jgi:hypothetical protein
MISTSAWRRNYYSCYCYWAMIIRSVALSVLSGLCFLRDDIRQVSNSYLARGSIVVFGYHASWRLWATETPFLYTGRVRFDLRQVLDLNLVR